MSDLIILHHKNNPLIEIRSTTGETLWSVSRVEGKLAFIYDETRLAEAGKRVIESWVMVGGSQEEQMEFQREWRRLLRAALNIEPTRNGGVDE